MITYLLGGSSTASSKTALVTFALGIFVLFWLKVLKNNLPKIKLFTVMLVSSLTFSILLIIQHAIAQSSGSSFLSWVFGLLGRDATLTGRADLWNDLMRIAAINPISGIGFGSFWIGDLAHNLWDKYHWMPGQGHNGYIDVYLHLGLIGIIILCMVVLSSTRKLIMNYYDNISYFELKYVLLMMILLSNISETVYLRGTHNLWLIFLLTVVTYTRKNNISDADS